jgi:hypothetical protein
LRKAAALLLKRFPSISSAFRLRQWIEKAAKKVRRDIPRTFCIGRQLII